MSEKPELTGYEPQLSNNDKSGLEPQLGGEQRRQSVPSILLRFVTQVAGESGMVYRLEDPRSGQTLAQIQRVGQQAQPLEPFKQMITVRGNRFSFESTGLSARLESPQGRWHIDYVKSLSTPMRIEWTLRDALGLPLGVMRLNKPMGWLEAILADNRKLCKTTIAPHRGGSTEIIVRTDWLSPGLEPLFMVALLFGLAISHELPDRPGF
jgi:hypothetical protein